MWYNRRFKNDEDRDIFYKRKEICERIVKFINKNDRLNLTNLFRKYPEESEYAKNNLFFVKLALRNKSSKMAKFLIENGFKISYTTAEICVKKKLYDMFDFLLEKNCPVNFLALDYAIEKKMYGIIKKIINIPGYKYFEFDVEEAVNINDFDLVEKLVKNGAPISQFAIDKAKINDIKIYEFLVKQKKLEEK